MISLSKSNTVVPVGPEIAALRSIVSSFQLLSDEAVYEIMYRALDRLHKITTDEHMANEQVVQHFFNTGTLLISLHQYHKVSEIGYICEQFSLIAQTYTTNAA